MFGLSGPEGNHGEDVKDYWWYLDAVPSSAWLRWRYHYPQAAFPYEDLVQTNAARSKLEPEYELIDTGIFDDDRYWIVEVHYAKATADRHPDARHRAEPGARGGHAPRPPDALVPQRVVVEPGPAASRSCARRRTAGRSWRATPSSATTPSRSARARTARSRRLLFCENETNRRADRGLPGDHAVSEGRHQRPRHRRCGDGQPRRDRHEGLALVPPRRAARRDRRDPAAAAQVPREAASGERRAGGSERPPHDTAEATARPRTSRRSIRSDRVRVDDARARPRPTTSTRPSVARAGRTKSDGSCARHSPACSGASSTTATTSRAGSTAIRACRRRRPSGRPARNATWRHFDAADVMSMPDPWEYPWFAAWDLAFHAVTFAHIDPAFAKYQLLLLCREWFQHPNGALPAYEWSFDDVNPPVHAAAAYLVWYHRWAHGFRLPPADLPQAAAQLHVVAQPPGQGGQRPLRGRVPGPRQHRRLRPVAPARRHRARAVRRDRLDVPVLPEHAADRDRPVRARPVVRGLPDDVHGARGPDRRGDDPERPVGRRRTASSTTHSSSADGTAVPIKVHSMVGLIPLLPVASITGADGPAGESLGKRFASFMEALISAATGFGRAATSPAVAGDQSSSSVSSRRPI